VISNINLSPGSPRVGDEITFWVFVKNDGAARAGASALRFKVGGETFPPEIPVPALDPGQEYRYERKLTLPLVNIHSDGMEALPLSKESRFDFRGIQTKQHCLTTAGDRGRTACHGASFGKDLAPFRHEYMGDVIEIGSNPSSSNSLRLAAVRLSGAPEHIPSLRPSRDEDSGRRRPTWDGFSTGCVTKGNEWWSPA
jgi:hypothetical protein